MNPKCGVATTIGCTFRARDGDVLCKTHALLAQARAILLDNNKPTEGRKAAWMAVRAAALRDEQTAEHRLRAIGVPVPPRCAWTAGVRPRD